MKAKKIISAIFSLTLIFTANAFSLAVPELKGRVNDYANIMNKEEEAVTSKYLENLENSTGIQIAVLTIPSLKGENLEDFSIRTVEKWKLGQSKEDNGALLLISLAERKVRIETGYGLEGKLTDTKCGLIIRNVIAPAFRSGKYAAGIYSAVKYMGALASDNAELIEENVTDESNDTAEDLASLVYGILFVLGWIVVFSNITRRRFFRWLPWLWLGNMMGGSRHYNSYNSHDTFGGFGSSDSGFSGGGGHFGGGGASGGW